MSDEQGVELKMQFSDFDAESVPNVARLSRAAIGSVLVGLFAWLALLHPALWSVPVVGLVLGVLAIRLIGRDPQMLTGRGWAAFGMALCLFCLAYAPMRLVTRQSHLYAESERMAREWFTLIADGKIREAHQLRLRPQLRVAADDRLEDFYKNGEHQQDFDEFVRDPFVKKLMGELIADRTASQPVSINVTLDTNISVNGGGEATDIVTQRFRIERKTAQGASERVTVRVEMHRAAFTISKESMWMVRSSSLDG